VSDGATNRPGPARQAHTRRKGGPRGGRHGLSRSVVPAEIGIETVDLEMVTPRATARSRRMPAERMAPTPVLNRAAEMAYVRADMRRLLVISGVLLALMLAILVLIGR
jgi:hypothetical protein